MSKKKFWLVVLLGAGIGFLLGLTYGLRLNQPFDGIFQSSADVQGLTYYSWVAFSLIGSFVGAIAGFFASALLYKTKSPSKPIELDEMKE